MKRVPRVMIIILAGLIVTLPCLLYGFPYYADDSAWSAIFLSQFSQQFWTGELYPRWLQGLNGGLGNPTAFYYPPVAYWLTSLVRLPVRHQLGISAVVAVVLSGVAVFLWLRRSVSARAASVASLIYLILPYHLNTDLYARGALAELWTFVWMPLILLAVDSVIERRRFAVIGLAVAYALLIMTHLPTTLIFSLVPLAYSLCLGDNKRSFLLVVAGMALGIGLSAIYLLPAMTMQDFIFHTTEGIGGHYYFGNWFLFTDLRWSGSGSEYFYVATEVLCLAVLAFVVVRKLKGKSYFWFGVALCSFLMMTPVSKPIWQLLPSLQKIQFPFRFNTVLSLSVMPLVALGLEKSAGRARLLVTATLAVFAVIWLGMTAHRAYYAYPAHHIDQNVIDVTNRRLEQRRDTNEFRPRWVVSIEEGELDAQLRRVGGNKVNVVSGDASISVNRWQPRSIELHVTSKDGATLDVSQFYFPGWMVRVDDAAEARAVEPSKPGGLIRLVAPSGEHKITLELGKRMPEAAGQVISLASLIVLIIWATNKRR